jgi:hypothetical protein
MNDEYVRNRKEVAGTYFKVICLRLIGETVESHKFNPLKTKLV